MSYHAENAADRRERDRVLTQAFHAGNYASAYETEDYAEASAGLPRTGAEEYHEAFLLGFFSAYERDEVPIYHLAKYDRAVTSAAGHRLAELGLHERCWLVAPGSVAEVAP